MKESSEGNQKKSADASLPQEKPLPERLEVALGARRPVQKSFAENAFSYCAEVQTLYSFVARLFHRNVENKLRLGGRE
jgi:hypothetical protein